MVGPLAGGAIFAGSGYLAAHLAGHWGAVAIPLIGLVTFLASLAQYASEQNGQNR